MFNFALTKQLHGWNRLRKQRKNDGTPEGYGKEYPSIDPADIDPTADIGGVSLQRKITGPLSAELRVLMQINGAWYVVIHERCIGTIDESVEFAH